MSKEIKHSHIQDPSLMHQTFHYQQLADPGAVGVTSMTIMWLATSLTEVVSGSFGYQLKIRNYTNDGWITI